MQPILNFPKYSIYEDGRVYSSKSGKFLKQRLFPSGGKYLSVSLSKEGKLYIKTIHRLVAEAFIPNPENKPQVNHRDGNKLNNNVNNLEWVTCSENTYHAYALGLRYISDKHRESARRQCSINGRNNQIKRDWINTKANQVEYNICAKDLSRKYFDQRLDYSKLNDVAAGRDGRKQHKGWRLLNPN